MNIDLNKDGLVKLVLASTPRTDECVEALIDKGYGTFTGTFNDITGLFEDSWGWYISELELLSENELYNIYLRCTKSYALKLKKD